MIDAKSFMAFFEKEYGVEFKDANTGKNALNTIHKEQKCVNCTHVICGDGETLHEDDMVCGNPDSEYATCFRMHNDTCILWEAGNKGI